MLIISCEFELVHKALICMIKCKDEMDTQHRVGVALGGEVSICTRTTHVLSDICAHS